MILSIPGLGILKILCLALLHQLLGLIWYSPWLFGYKWLYLRGLSPLGIERNGYWPLLVSFVSSMIIILVMRWLFIQIAVKRLKHGLVVALLSWFAFSFCVTVTHVAFGQTSFKLLIINSGYDLFVFLITAIALVYWFKLGGVK